MVNEGEKRFYFYLKGNEGSFYTALFDALFKADTFNLWKFGLGFPEETSAVSRYRNESGYYDGLIKRVESER